MTSKVKDSYGSEAVEPGDESLQQDRLPDSTHRDKIRRRAYEIYLERGSEPGRDLEDWLQAERELTMDSPRQPANSARGTGQIPSAGLGSSVICKSIAGSEGTI